MGWTGDGTSEDVFDGRWDIILFGDVFVVEVGGVVLVVGDGDIEDVAVVADGQSGFGRKELLANVSDQDGAMDALQEFAFLVPLCSPQDCQACLKS